MKLEQQRTNILSLTYGKQLEFFTLYSEKRHKALSVIIPAKKIKEAAAQKKGKQINVTSEQLELLKSLGLI